MRALISALPVLLIAAACSGRPATTTTDHPTSTTKVSVAAGTCGRGWTDLRGGPRSFEFVNDGSVAVQADLVDPRSGAVFAEVEGLGPGTSRIVRLVVGRGRYAFRCIPAGGSTVVGPTVAITSGPRHGAPGVVPAQPAELIAALKRYDASVTAGLAQLLVKTLALRRAIGHRAQAQDAWLTAHLAYETLGAAYGAFGDYADAIDGIPVNGVPGADRPELTGFHRVEYLLWHGAPPARIRPVVAALLRDVTGLQKDFPDQRIDPNDLALRAHEILEAALEFQLTGDADQGSGTSLATVDANITGTEIVLQALAPVLHSRYSLGKVRADLGTLRRLLRAQHRDGRWTPVERLSRTDRERIDAATGAALEDLAPIAVIAGVRRSE